MSDFTLGWTEETAFLDDLQVLLVHPVAFIAGWGVSYSLQYIVVSPSLIKILTQEGSLSFFAFICKFELYSCPLRQRCSPAAPSSAY